MSLVFTETLRGSYFLVDTPDDVRVCEVAASIRVKRPRPMQPTIDGQITGIATFEGMAAGVPVRGTLKLQSRRPRLVSYEFSFADAQGRTLLFRGAKHPSLMRPLYSATTLWGSLFDGEAAIAMVRLHFDLRRDLALFVASLTREKAREE